MELPLILLAIAVVLIAVLILNKRKQESSVLDKIPRPPERFFFGHFFEMFGGETGQNFLEWKKQYGGVFLVKRLSLPRVIITEPLLAKQVLHNSQIFTKKNEIYEFLAAMLGRGLVTMSDEDVHKKQRAIIAPAFAHRYLKGLVPIFTQKGSILVSQWIKSRPSDPVDIRAYLAKATSDVIGEAAFGYKMNSLMDNSPGTVYHTFKRALGGNLSVFDVIPYIRHIVPAAFARRHAVSSLNTVVERILKNKVNNREVLKKQNAQTTKDVSESNTERSDLLDILLDCMSDEGETLSHAELIDHTKTFLLAGYETSSTALLWIMYALAERSEMQEKLAQEVISFFGKDGIPSGDEVEKLPYMDKIVKESMRWRPPVPSVIRTTSEDVMVGDYLIPKGVIVLVSIYVQHHDPKYWSNPEEFDPERWNNMPEEVMYNGTYIPFVLGPRNCIGSRFALIEIKCILALIVQKLKFSLVPGLNIKRTNRITMTPHPDVLCYFTPRK